MATLANCRNLVRGFTGRLDTAQVSDSYVNSLINEFYTVDFPARIQLQEEFQPFAFPIYAGQTQYPLPADFIEFEPGLTINDQNLKLYQNVNDFYREYKTPFATFLKGPYDGVLTTSTMTLPFAIIESSLFVITSHETFRDLGNGVLQSNLGGNGTYDAVTRLVTLSFAKAPANNEYIRFTYQLAVPSVPQACVIDGGNLIIRPIPDQSYIIQGHWYLRFAPLVSDTDELLYPEWLRYVAYGASAKVFEENGELDQSMSISVFLEREKCLAMARSNNSIIASTTRRSF